MPPPLGCGSGPSPRWAWDLNPLRSQCPHPSPGSTSKRDFGQRLRLPYTRNSQKGLPCACSSTQKKRTKRIGNRHNTEVLFGGVQLGLSFACRFLPLVFWIGLLPIPAWVLAPVRSRFPRVL